MIKSKYEGRAKELCSTLFEEPCEWEENSIESDFLILMLRLATEVEREVTKLSSASMLDLLIEQRKDLYTKEKVDELLLKQRELCAEQSRMKNIYDYDNKYLGREIDKNSILEAKLKTKL